MIKRNVEEVVAFSLMVDGLHSGTTLQPAAYFERKDGCCRETLLIIPIQHFINQSKPFGALVGQLLESVRSQLYT